MCVTLQVAVPKRIIAPAIGVTAMMKVWGSVMSRAIRTTIAAKNGLGKVKMNASTNAAGNNQVYMCGVVRLEGA